MSIYETIIMQHNISQLHHPPTRTFVTKYEPEIISNQRKRKSRNRDRDAKYADHFETASLDDDIAQQDLNERIIMWRFRCRKFFNPALHISDDRLIKLQDHVIGDDVPFHIKCKYFKR
jgi:hypothetical protein